MLQAGPGMGWKCIPNIKAGSGILLWSVAEAFRPVITVGRGSALLDSPRWVFSKP